MKYDVAIIGAGVIGCMSARALSKYDMKVCLLEAGSDVCGGASKANSGIVHSGYDPVPGSRKAHYNVLGANMMEQICEELSVKYRKNGSLVLAFTEEECESIQELFLRGIQNGVFDLQMIKKEELIKLEPNVSESIKKALYSPTAGIVCPYTLTIAAAENAVDNGVELFLNAAVTEAKQENQRWVITAGGNEIDTKMVVNAAGVHAGTVANLFGDDTITIMPRKGEYILCDKPEHTIVNSVVFQAPTVHGKGVLITQTVDNNLLIGPTSHRTEDTSDTATTKDGITELIQTAQKSVSDLPLKDVLTTFTGIRASSDTGDFIVSFSEYAQNLFHIAGIDSPGLTASPAIAEEVARSIAEKLDKQKKPDFNPYRTTALSIGEMNPDQRANAMEQNPCYGHIVCRCEKISEAEILDAIRSLVPATTLDGVKRRVRAGMGRCQGGFCGPTVAKILSRELNIPLSQIVKDKMRSEILTEKMKKGI